MIRLIPRADDAGVTTGTNQAIYKTATDGIIRNIGLMVPTPAFEEAVELLNPMADEVDLGIHATLTSEWEGFRWGPVSAPEKVSTLLEDDSTFVRSPHVLNESASREEMIFEVEAQIRKALDCGLEAKYLDTHMVFSWIEGMQERLEELGSRYGLIVDSKQRFPTLPKPKEVPLSEDLLEAFVQKLEAAEPGKVYVFVTHPSAVDAHSNRMHKTDGQPGEIATERAEEAAFLCSAALKQLLQERGVSLLRYSEA